MFYISSVGDVFSPGDVTYLNQVKPVFYLNYDVQYVSGDGTQESPYRIA